MKKLILSMSLCFFAFNSMNAAPFNASIETDNLKVISYSYEINSFCKLIQMGNYEAVKSLIKAGENVNKKSNGLTPLMFAARHNKAKIVKLLIKHGAKLKVKSDKGNMTALDMAKRSKAKEAIKVIEAIL